MFELKALQAEEIFNKLMRAKVYFKINNFIVEIQTDS
jgi:hypothetical protein